MIKKFEVGHWYRFTGIVGKNMLAHGIRKNWDSYGDGSIMCAVLDGKPRLCTKIVKKDKFYANFENVQNPKEECCWYWEYGFDFWEEVFNFEDLKTAITQILE